MFDYLELDPVIFRDKEPFSNDFVVFQLCYILFVNLWKG